MSVIPLGLKEGVDPPFAVSHVGKEHGSDSGIEAWN